MSKHGKTSISAQMKATPLEKQMRITVDNCAVTLNFPSNKHDSIMTEVKRMILIHAKL